MMAGDTLHLCGDCGVYVVNSGQWDPEAYEDPEEARKAILDLGYISVKDVYRDEYVECAACGAGDIGSVYEIN